MDFQFLLLFIVVFLVGIWFINIVGWVFGEVDYGSIVWDEIVFFWLVLLLMFDILFWQFVVFVFFCFYDIIKFQFVCYFDEYVKNGFGVMVDDLMVVGYILFLLVLLKIVLF